MDQQIFQPPSSQQSIISEPEFNQPQKPKNTRLSFLIAIAVLVGAVAYGGIWWWGNRSTEVAVPTFTPRPDPTANWQTYRNEEYGFEFRYPEGWKEINTNGFALHLREPFIKEDHTKENVLTLDSMGWARVEDNLEQKLGILVFDNSVDSSTIIPLGNDSAYLSQIEKRVTNGVDVWASGPYSIFGLNCSFTSSFLNLDQGKSASLIFENCLLNAGFGQKPDPSEAFDQALSTFRFTN